MRGFNRYLIKTSNNEVLNIINQLVQINKEFDVKFLYSTDSNSLELYYFNQLLTIVELPANYDYNINLSVLYQLSKKINY